VAISDHLPAGISGMAGALEYLAAKVQELDARVTVVDQNGDPFPGPVVVQVNTETGAVTFTPPEEDA
jgi:hypothetical protein